MCRAASTRWSATRLGLAGTCMLLMLAACNPQPSARPSIVHTDARATPVAGRPSSDGPTRGDRTADAATLIAQARAPSELPATSTPSPAEKPTARPVLPESPPGAGKPSARPVSDAELAARVKSAVLAEPMSALMFDVNVTNGVVTLSGTADTGETRDKAVRAASGVQGVKSVNNRISVLSGS